MKSFNPEDLVAWGLSEDELEDASEEFKKVMDERDKKQERAWAIYEKFPDFS